MAQVPFMKQNGWNCNGFLSASSLNLRFLQPTGHVNTCTLLQQCQSGVAQTETQNKMFPTTPFDRKIMNSLKQTTADYKISTFYTAE